MYTFITYNSDKTYISNKKTRVFYKNTGSEAKRIKRSILIKTSKNDTIRRVQIILCTQHDLGVNI